MVCVVSTAKKAPDSPKQFSNEKNKQTRRKQEEEKSESAFRGRSTGQSEIEVWEEQIKTSLSNEHKV